MRGGVLMSNKTEITQGTPFQQRVWRAISLIPKGKVTSYGAIAKYLNTGAYRAVGSAVGKNPYAPEIPCHRVVNSDGNIGGYSGEGGIDSKVKLLKSEGVEVTDGKIAEFEKHYYDYSDTFSHTKEKNH